MPGGAKDFRGAADRLRLLILETHHRRGGHLGAALSIVEILTVLCDGVLAEGYNQGPDGHHLILSKGHAALGLYCRLAIEGRIAPSALAGFASDGSDLEPHPNELRVPGVGASSGSLGQGLSIGCGLALAAKLSGRDDLCAVIVGDGETNEGQIWEAVLSAPQLRLGNLLVVVDRNGMQQDGPMREILPAPDLETVWGAMGWATARCDGHDVGALDQAIGALLTGPAHSPKLLVADTVKGAGVAYLEGRTESHFPDPVSAEEIALARYRAARRPAPVPPSPEEVPA